MSQFSKAAPAIAIVPDDLDVLSFRVLPPIFELFLRDVERRRGDEVVEDDIVLFAPAEGAEVVEIVVVEQLLRNRFRGDVRGAIDKFRRQEKRQCRQL